MEAGKQQVDDVQNYLEQLEPAVELLDDCGYTGVVGLSTIIYSDKWRKLNHQAGRARVYCLGRLDIDRSSIEGYSPSLLSTTSSESKNFDILPSGVQSVRSTFIMSHSSCRTASNISRSPLPKVYLQNVSHVTQNPFLGPFWTSSV